MSNPRDLFVEIRDINLAATQCTSDIDSLGSSLPESSKEALDRLSIAASLRTRLDTVQRRWFLLADKAASVRSCVAKESRNGVSSNYSSARHRRDDDTLNVPLGHNLGQRNRSEHSMGTYGSSEIPDPHLSPLHNSSKCEGVGSQGGEEEVNYRRTQEFLTLAIHAAGEAISGRKHAETARRALSNIEKECFSILGVAQSSTVSPHMEKHRQSKNYSDKKVLLSSGISVGVPEQFSAARATAVQAAMRRGSLRHSDPFPTSTASMLTGGTKSPTRNNLPYYGVNDSKSITGTHRANIFRPDGSQCPLIHAPPPSCGVTDSPYRHLPSIFPCPEQQFISYTALSGSLPSQGSKIINDRTSILQCQPVERDEEERRVLQQRSREDDVCLELTRLLLISGAEEQTKNNDVCMELAKLLLTTKER